MSRKRLLLLALLCLVIMGAVSTWMRYNPEQSAVSPRLFGIFIIIMTIALGGLLLTVLWFSTSPNRTRRGK
jgi:hypothetical protein